VTHHLGLVTPYNKPFPHEAAECEQLQHALRQHRVLARHGDVFDPLSFGDDRDGASLADVLAIELIARFLQHVESELAEQIPAATWAALCEIDQIRPILLVPAYMESILERTATPVIRNRIKRMWDYMVEQMLHLEIVQRMCGTSPVDLIDGLSAALKFSRRDTQNWIGRTLGFIAGLRGATSMSYASHAMSEADFRNRRARHVVYGHTHQHEIVPRRQPCRRLRAEPDVLQRWHLAACYQPTQLLAGNHELVASDCFSLLAFYHGDERNGRTHETWCGTLAPAAIDIIADKPAAMPAAVIPAPFPPRFAPRNCRRPAAMAGLLI
jgi:hypothetical protein